MLLQLHNGTGALCFRDLIDIVVTGHKLQRPLVLEDFLYLTIEQPVLGHLLQEQLTIGSQLHTAKIFVSSDPHGVLAVANTHRNTIDARSMNDAPAGTVVIEQALEVSHENRTVLTFLDIVVTIVTTIFFRRIVANQGKTLRPSGTYEE